MRWVGIIDQAHMVARGGQGEELGAGNSVEHAAAAAQPGRRRRLCQIIDLPGFRALIPEIEPLADDLHGMELTVLWLQSNIFDQLRPAWHGKIKQTQRRRAEETSNFIISWPGAFDNIRIAPIYREPDSRPGGIILPNRAGLDGVRQVE